MWIISKVEKTRTKTTWQKGDSVTVYLTENADPENPQRKQMAWPYHADQTPTEFRNMVKAEIKAHLRALNRKQSFHDVTQAFTPADQ